MAKLDMTQVIVARSMLEHALKSLEFTENARYGEGDDKWDGLLANHLGEVSKAFYWMGEARKNLVLK